MTQTVIVRLPKPPPVRERRRQVRTMPVSDRTPTTEATHETGTTPGKRQQKTWTRTGRGYGTMSRTARINQTFVRRQVRPTAVVVTPIQTIDACPNSHFPPTEEVKRLEAIQGRFQEVQKRVLTYNVKVSVDGALVSVDGVNVDPTPLSTPVFLEPGVHVVMVRKDGFKTADRKVTAVAGATDAWDVTLLAVESAPPPVVAPPVAPTATAVVLPQPFVEPPRDSSASKPNPWILVGGGVVTVGAVVTGLVFNSKANSAYDKASALKSDIGSSGCTTGLASSSACGQAKKHLDDGDRQRTISEVAFGAGGVALAATAVYWLWPRKASTGTSNAPTLSSSIGPNGAWIGLRGTY